MDDGEVFGMNDGRRHTFIIKDVSHTAAARDRVGKLSFHQRSRAFGEVQRELGETTMKGGHNTDFRIGSPLLQLLSVNMANPPDRLRRARRISSIHFRSRSARCQGQDTFWAGGDSVHRCSRGDY